MSSSLRPPLLGPSRIDRVAAPVVLVIGGIIGLLRGVDDATGAASSTATRSSESLVARLGTVMLLVGVWHLVPKASRAPHPGGTVGSPYRRPPPKAAETVGREVGELLLGALLFAVGILGLFVGASTQTPAEACLEILMASVGAWLFIERNRDDKDQAARGPDVAAALASGRASAEDDVTTLEKSRQPYRPSM